MGIDGDVREIEKGEGLYLGDFIDLVVIDGNWFTPLGEFIEKHGEKFALLLEAAWIRYWRESNGYNLLFLEHIKSGR